MSIAGLSTDAVTADDLGRRAPSVGLIAKIVGLTLALAGAVFTLGNKWGATGTDIDIIRAGLATEREVRNALESRVRAVEDTKTSLSPAVATLAATTAKLGEAVVSMRENIAAQTVEIRQLREAVGELRGKIK